MEDDKNDTSEPTNLYKLNKFPHNEIVFSIDEASEGLKVSTIKKRIADAHKVPTHAVILFRDPERQKPYEKDDETVEITNPGGEDMRLYWALLGDAPSSWLSKRSMIDPSIDRLLHQLKDQLDTCSFNLEDAFYKAKMEEFHNNVPDGVPHNLPLVVTRTHPKDLYFTYATDVRELRAAYEKHNPGWAHTSHLILERIAKLRTDKIQYEINLRQLEENERVLRQKIQELSGRLFPPFPDSGLYTSLFFDPKFTTEADDLIWRSLVNSVESNTVYYHQELGKYSILKKEECGLLEKFAQLETRMKLWILRERVRLIEWELNQYQEDEDVILVLKQVRDVNSYEGKALESTFCYQCLDFCQCQQKSALRVLTQESYQKIEIGK